MTRSANQKEELGSTQKTYDVRVLVVEPHAAVTCPAVDETRFRNIIANHFAKAVARALEEMYSKRTRGGLYSTHPRRLVIDIRLKGTAEI